MIRESYPVTNKALLRALDLLYRQQETRMLSTLKDLPQFKKELTMFHTIGLFWDCPESPLGLCVYHTFKDKPHDDCVFCHQPEERK